MKKIDDFIFDQKRAIRYYSKRGWVLWRMRLVRDWLYWCIYFRTFCYWDVAFLESPGFWGAVAKTGVTDNISKVAKLHGVDGWDDDE